MTMTIVAAVNYRTSYCLTGLATNTSSSSSSPPPPPSS